MDGFYGEPKVTSIFSILEHARGEAAKIPDEHLVPHSIAWQLKHGCLKTLQYEEPIFVLRGQDRSAPAAVDTWAANALLQNVDLSKVDLARHCAKTMREWDGQKKTPD